jgi:excisionase family DNA binding protein
VPTDDRPRRPAGEPALARVPEILDVAMAAAFLTVSRDTVYHLFQSGQLPGRKVGRKWVTTKAAVIRWIEQSSADDSLARAMKRGDGHAIAKAISTGKLRVRPSPLP